jgi:hypothetical protein
LKGVAGNLGATALAEVARNAETAVKTGQGVEAALDSLSVSLDAVVRAIRSALPPEARVDSGCEASADPAIVLEPLSRLKRLLEGADCEAAEFIADARRNLSGVLTGPEILTLTELVDEFDFDAALKCLSGIAARLSLNLS